MGRATVLKELVVACTILVAVVYVAHYLSPINQCEGITHSLETQQARNTDTRESLEVSSVWKYNTGVPPQHVDDRSIDLEMSVPTVKTMYDRLVLITAISDNHYTEAMGYIGSAQKYMPGRRIIIYKPTKVKSLCNVEIRKFHFNKYPNHLKNLRSYAWKPVIINLALNEFGAIYYGDASIRFTKSLKELLPGIERHHGYMTNILHWNPTRHSHHYNLTVPDMFVKLGVDRQEYHDCNNSAPHIQPGTQLIINSTTIKTKLMQPWLYCALKQACITPKGSSRKNHRQDASAITLLVYKNLFGEWTKEDNDTKKMQSVIDVERRRHGFKYNPRYCKVKKHAPL